MFYPVGSIYITTNNQNPSEYIGGKWESYGEGRTIVGAGTGADENNVQKVFEINQTGGEYQHTLTVNEMPSHNHRNFVINQDGTVAKHAITVEYNSKPNYNNSGYYTTNTGGSQAHNNIQPYIVTYMWKRIS